MTDEAAVAPALTLKLKKPLKAHGEMVETLSFRAPTGADIIEIGNPVILDLTQRPPVITHDTRKMAQMMARLGSINPGALAEIDVNDFSEACWMLTDFFHAGVADDLIEAGLRVAWIYKTDPFAVLAKPAHAVFDVLRRTNDLIEDFKANYG